MRNELKEEIEDRGENVIHQGEIDNTGTHHQQVGQVTGDQWYVYTNSEWYFVKEYTEVLKVRQQKEYGEDFQERAQIKEILEYDKADIHEMREFLNGHKKEVIDFFNSTMK